MEVRAKVDETDRDNLQSGQTADGRDRRAAGQTFTAKVGALSGLALARQLLRDRAPSASSTSRSRSTSPIRGCAPGRRPRVVIDGQEIPDALQVPRQAVFEKNGKTFVFSRPAIASSGATSRSSNSTESRAAIERPQRRRRDRAGRSDVAASAARRRLVELAAAERAMTGRRTVETVTRAAAQRAPLVDRLPARAAARAREPPRPQAALAADDARHDLRRRGGRRDAVDRRRRAAGGDGVHRAARRAQPDRRSARGGRRPGAAEGAQAVGRAVVPGPARHPGQPRRHHRRRRARKRFTPTKLLPRPHRRRYAGRLRRQRRRTRRSRNLRSPRAGSSTRPRRSAAAPVAVLGEAAAAALFGADDPVGHYVKVNEQWFQVIGVAGPQLTVQSRRRRPAGAGPQQPDLRAALLVDLPARGRPELAEGRDRRHLPADAVERRRARGRGAAARHARRRAPRRRRLHHRLAGGAARRAAAHAAHLRDGHGGDRVDLAAGRRHRDHEHHAGQRAGADARDRRPPRHRRASSATSSASS